MKKRIIFLSTIMMFNVTACTKSNDLTVSQDKDNKVINLNANISNFDYIVNPETFELKINVNGKEQIASFASETRKVENFKQNKNKTSWIYPNEQIEVTLIKQNDYLDINIKSLTKEKNEFTFPNIAGENYILPLNEGKYINKDDELWKDYFENTELKGIESLSMQFFGVQNGNNALVYVIKNPYNNTLNFNTNENIKFSFKHTYPKINENKEYGFIIYATDNNITNIAKIYKSYVIEQGKFKTLKEKEEENDNISKLYGAPHIYFWDRNIISEEDIKWQQLKNKLDNNTINWFKKLLIENTEDGTDLANVFDEIKKLDYVDKYNKSRILKSFFYLVQMEDFYNPNIFKDLDSETKNIIAKGIDNLNEVEIIELNKRLLKSVLKDSITNIEEWGDANTIDILEDMKQSGIDNAWIGFDDWVVGYLNPELVQYANENEYLIGTYDSYHSIHKPGEEQWETAKFEDTSLYENATVENENGEKIEGFQGVGRKLNPILAMPSVKNRVSKIMNNNIPFNSWFLDTDGTGEVYDDYSKNHITTKEQDINARIERIEYLEKEYGMVVGTEGGNDFVAPYVDFAHGIETPTFTWRDEDMRANKESEYYVGRYYSKNNGVPEMFSKQVPLKENLRQLFISPKYSIPLYKLVYNDSVITTHWWGYGTLKFKDDIADRMLYEVLYNVPPLYHIDKEEWDKHKDTIVNHTNFWADISKDIINEEMINFEILSEDRLVQKTQFSNGISIIANFSDNEFSSDNINLKPHSLKVLFIDKEIEYIPNLK